ncbi:hypothetical protein C1645_879461 [Glomus cerebriforme]|uniref:Uncharacterized protein n=1 Tax=Glomus cerebriforme TaxID=658196 RepID=A0A397SQT8_9GLOM|nr:hypothetical protein C1645_879461 [Glomus cerebriforme]
MNMVYKDKSGKPREQVIKEKIKIMVLRYENENQEEDDDDIAKLTLMVNKYINNEFEDIPYHPKQEIEKALNEKLPIELVEMITKNNEEGVELWNTEPIKTNEINIEWLEGLTITQPWELTREFEWKEEDLIPDNEVQKINTPISDFEPQVDIATEFWKDVDEYEVRIREQENFQIKLGNEYLQQCKFVEEIRQEIKRKEEYVRYMNNEYEDVVQEYEKVIKALILENELIKKELEEENGENITMEMWNDN